MEKNMEATIYNPFATPIYKSSIGRDFTKEELEFLTQKAYEGVRHDGNWVTDDKGILDYDVMSDIKQKLQTNLDNYLESIYTTSDDVRLVPVISWVTRCDKGNYHPPHNHQNSVASAIIYVSVGDVDGTIFFRPGMKRWDLTPREETYYNADTYYSPAKPGGIAIFPSDIMHYVPTVMHDVTRIAISVNTFFEGSIGRAHGGTLLNFKSDKKCGKDCKNCKCKS